MLVQEQIYPKTAPVFLLFYLLVGARFMRSVDALYTSLILKPRAPYAHGHLGDSMFSIWAPNLLSYQKASNRKLRSHRGVDEC